MKKSLLKASLICLGAILLCGMSSFRTPEVVKLQQDYRTIAIYNDTIISDREEPECTKKEVVIDGGKNGYSCTLKVEYSESKWSLRIEKSGLTERDVQVTYEYKLYSANFENGSSGDYKNSSSKTIRCTDVIPGNYLNTPILCDDYYYNSICVPISIKACFVQ